MTTIIAGALGLAVAFASMTPSEGMAQRRRVAVRRAPHTRLVVGVGHPIHRRLPANVTVHPAHNVVVVGAPLVFLPALVWTAPVIGLPAREKLRWQDSEVITRDEGWVDANFGIDGTGDALFLQVRGSASFNFAEVTFANGHVQVVDFTERTHGSGIYKLVDFSSARHVMTARILASSKSEDTKLTLYLGT